VARPIPPLGVTFGCHTACPRPQVLFFLQIAKIVWCIFKVKPVVRGLMLQ
jgi:hypothetical protein